MGGERVFVGTPGTRLSPDTKKMIQTIFSDCAKNLTAFPFLVKKARG